MTTCALHYYYYSVSVLLHNVPPTNSPILNPNLIHNAVVARHTDTETHPGPFCLAWSLAVAYPVAGIHQPPPQLNCKTCCGCQHGKGAPAYNVSSDMTASRLAKQYRTRYGRICMMLECLWNVESLLVHNCVQIEIIRYAQAQTQVRVGGIFACHGVGHSTACRGKRMTTCALHYYYYSVSVLLHNVPPTNSPILNPNLIHNAVVARHTDTETHPGPFCLAWSLAVAYPVAGIHQPPPQLNCKTCCGCQHGKGAPAYNVSSDMTASRLAKQYRTRYGRICMMLECLWNVESLLVTHWCTE